MLGKAAKKLTASSKGEKVVAQSVRPVRPSRVNTALISAHIPVHLHREFKAAAARQGLTMAALLEISVTQTLTEIGSPKPPFTPSKSAP